MRTRARFSREWAVTSSRTYKRRRRVPRTAAFCLHAAATRFRGHGQQRSTAYDFHSGRPQWRAVGGGRRGGVVVRGGAHSLHNNIINDNKIIIISARTHAVTHHVPRPVH